MISDLAFDNFRFKVKLKFLAKKLLVVTSLATVNFYLRLVLWSYIRENPVRVQLDRQLTAPVFPFPLTAHFPVDPSDFPVGERSGCTKVGWPQPRSSGGVWSSSLGDLTGRLFPVKNSGEKLRLYRKSKLVKLAVVVA